MTKKADAGGLPKPRWMTQCDVIRYNLNIPQDLKHQLKKEALQKGMDVSTYNLWAPVRRHQEKENTSIIEGVTTFNS